MRSLTARAESGVLVVILVVVAVAAGWASFSHVHDWTMRHVPAGTPDAFGWVNAVISELVPVAAFLTIRRRRRTGQPIGYPLFLLLAGGALSLAAQLAVAQPSPSGWLLSAVPALAFMALVKLVFTGSTPNRTVKAADPQPAPVPEPVDQVHTNPDPAPAVVDQDHAPEPDPVPAPPANIPVVEEPRPVPTVYAPRPAVVMPSALVSSVVQPPRVNGHIVSGVIR